MLSRRTVVGSVGGLLATGVTGVRAAETPRFRLGVAGLVHGHISGFFDKATKRTDTEIVGAVEADDQLVRKVFDKRGFVDELRFRTVEDMIERGRPDAIAIYSSTFDHTAIVKAAAARGVHVMMEKPLAVSVAHAQQMAAAAKRGKIHVLVNYETTWYPSHGRVWDVVKKQARIGQIRKMVAHDGHGGPIEIGCGKEFLAWLTDPVKNGAGALFDFGCYGANLMTWLMDGRRPTSVSAMVQTNKPDKYKVDDESTILVTYPGAQGIIQGSWSWPYSRKDLEVYGDQGFAIAVNAKDTRVRIGKTPEESAVASALPAPHDDSISYFIAVARGQLAPEGLSSLDNNLIVTEILEAAKRSAASGRTVRL